MFSLSISPIAFTIFGLPIYWYGIIYAFAIFLSWSISVWVLKKMRNNKKQVPTKEEFDRFMFYLILWVLIGARLGHILFFDLEYYIEHPAEIFMLRNGGLSFHGGTIGLAAYIFIYHRKTKYSWKMMSDILCFSAALGLGIGRIANFINQELYGKISTASNSVIFSFVDHMPRYPTQLYESFFEGFLNFWIMFVFFRIKGVNIIGTGKLTSIFCIVYSSSRFFIEFFKEVETYTYFNLITLTVGQILCLMLLLFGVAVLYLRDTKQSL